MSSQENSPNHPATAPHHRRKKCEMYDCRVLATYGFPRERKTRCKSHQMCGMIHL